jgi:hypothetical protein
LGFFGEAAAARRWPPPSAIAFRHLTACGRPELSDSDPTHPAARFTRKSPQPLDLDPTDLDRVKPESSQVNPAGSGVFAEKPLSFPIFTDISSRRDKTKPLRFSPFSFILAQFLLKPLQFSPCIFYRA